MIKGLMIYSNNMEDGEAILTRDLLTRAGIHIDTVSSIKKEVKTAYGVSVFADYELSEISLNEYEFLIIPGGKYVGEIVNQDVNIKALIMEFHEANKYIAAICAAPRFLGQLGLLDDKKFTCFPSSEIDMKKGIYLKNEKAVIDGKIITGRSVGAVVEFSALIIETLISKNAANKVIKEIIY